MASSSAWTKIARAPVDIGDDAYEIIKDNTLWTTTSWDDSFAINDAAIFPGPVDPADPWGQSAVNYDAFDGALAIFVQADEDAMQHFYGTRQGSSYVVDITTNGDTLVQAPVESMLGLDVSVEQRFYAAGDMARVLATYTNPSDAPITVVTGAFTNYGSDSNTILEADSSGDGNVTADDTWIVTGDGGWSDPVVTKAWATAGAALQPGFAALNQPFFESAGYSAAAFALTVEPGETAHLAYFVKIHGWLDDQVSPTSTPTAVGEGAEIAPAAAIGDSYAAAALAAAADAAEFDAFDGRLVAGLDAGTAVLNWGTVAGATDPADPADPADPVVADPTFTGRAVTSRGGRPAGADRPPRRVSPRLDRARSRRATGPPARWSPHGPAPPRAPRAGRTRRPASRAAPVRARRSRP